ncbi:hypothetical protein DAEQUDRAFT_244543 [Daedalea quercina L-15889]|uniref:Uncharacterized protein n=1 Tax=Daedalea quercina L-15889 TaxID=1314783 RepID=A0A165QSZ5_9APHY|nr:hypothetical protein DAEQUDRAFT_244543 [Daedalea quercina L-15889]
MSCPSTPTGTSVTTLTLDSVATSYSAYTLSFTLTNSTATSGPCGAATNASTGSVPGQTSCASSTNATAAWTAVVFPVPVLETSTFTQAITITLYDASCDGSDPSTSGSASISSDPPGLPTSTGMFNVLFIELDVTEVRTTTVATGHHKHVALDTAIVGVALGGAATIVVTTIAILLLRRWQRTKREEENRLAAVEGHLGAMAAALRERKSVRSKSSSTVRSRRGPGLIEARQMEVAGQKPAQGNHRNLSRQGGGAFRVPVPNASHPRPIGPHPVADEYADMTTLRNERRLARPRIQMVEVTSGGNNMQGRIL